MVAPTPYLTRLRDVLRATEPELWSFFAAAPRATAAAEQVRTDLLRSAYRLDDETHADVRAAVTQAAARLGLDDPVTLYQAQEGTAAQGNASVAALDSEVHVVFSGTLLDLLSADELVAVLGHELAHAVLWSVDGGDFWVLDRLVHASASDHEALPVHAETARLLRLHTELVADRGALLAVDGDLDATVSALVKLDTGLRSVSGAAYLRQAEEVLAADERASGSPSHPEGYFRAWALAQWHEHGPSCDERVAGRLAGPLHLDRLDLLGQHALTGLSQRLVRQFLEPAWARTDALLGHARHFGADVPRRGGAPPPPLSPAELTGLDDSALQYVGYLLLDLATVDEQVEEPALAAALRLSDDLGLRAQFDAVVGKELGLSAREVRARRTAAPAVLATVAGGA